MLGSSSNTTSPPPLASPLACRHPSISPASAQSGQTASTTERICKGIKIGVLSIVSSAFEFTAKNGHLYSLNSGVNCAPHKVGKQKKEQDLDKQHENYTGCNLADCSLRLFVDVIFRPTLTRHSLGLCAG